MFKRRFIAATFGLVAGCTAPSAQSQFQPANPPVRDAYDYCSRDGVERGLSCLRQLNNAWEMVCLRGRQGPATEESYRRLTACMDAEARKLGILTSGM